MGVFEGTQGADASAFGYWTPESQLISVCRFLHHICCTFFPIGCPIEAPRGTGPLGRIPISITRIQVHECNEGGEEAFSTEIVSFKYEDRGPGGQACTTPSSAGIIGYLA
jgi:hypothetical protein